MPNARSIYPLDMLPIILRLVVPRRKVLDRARRRLAGPEDIGPLLDRFLIVGGGERAVRAAVPDLHPWARAGIAGVHVADNIAPCFGGRFGLPAGAGVVPLVNAAGGGDEAAGWHAGIERYGGDKLGVGCC